MKQQEEAPTDVYFGRKVATTGAAAVLGGLRLVGSAGAREGGLRDTLERARTSDHS
jgi:hypothetical protein